MKNTGIVRKVDPLGRIVIPMELRKVNNIKVEDPMEIYTDGDKIILKKYIPSLLTPTEIALENLYREYGGNYKIEDKIKELELLIRRGE